MSETISVQGEAAILVYTDPDSVPDAAELRRDAIIMGIVCDSMPDACPPCHQEQTDFLENHARYWLPRLDVRKILDLIDERHGCAHLGKVAWSGVGMPPVLEAEPFGLR